VPGALALLRGLKGKAKVGIVSNNLEDEQREKLRYCGMDGLVDFLVTPDRVGAAKPDRLIFQAALARLDCSPQQAVMVGDSWEDDILGAQGAGIRAVWFNRWGLPPPYHDGVVELSSFQPAEPVLELLLNGKPPKA
jgi:putative hydrolase of the HAD superfamily